MAATPATAALKPPATRRITSSPGHHGALTTTRLKVEIIPLPGFHTTRAWNPRGIGVPLILLMLLMFLLPQALRVYSLPQNLVKFRP